MSGPERESSRTLCNVVWRKDHTMGAYLIRLVPLVPRHVFMLLRMREKERSLQSDPEKTITELLNAIENVTALEVIQQVRERLGN